MANEILHFSHANGFPSPCYRVLFDALRPQYDIGYIDQLGHNPQYPVTDNWPHLVSELIDYVENTYHKPVIAVGHSLGGVLSYMAAKQRPDLFKAFVMLDSPVLGPLESFVVAMAKRFNWVDSITPAGRTIGRRTQWPDRESARAYFQDKHLFRRTDPRCLHDYVSYGTREVEGGVELSFDAATEIAIFRTLPHRASGPKPAADVPGGLIYGRDSNVIRPYQVNWMRKKAGLRTRAVDGTHLFPFEYPEETARQILRMLSELNHG
ncbi:MAG: alpha/beta hydrolase [Oceanospirillaceae bacterium]|nr:alpha/beta hydrolase [Oceanospirillaceae bacterium]MCP5351535.1 alpha/beta hydrolase [Oceanospirillaceae bacterium]